MEKIMGRPTGTVSKYIFKGRPTLLETDLNPQIKINNR